MLREKIIQLSNLQIHLCKMKDLVSFYETQAHVSHDPLFGSFLKNVADKKSIQLIIIERMLRNRGIEMLPLESAEPRKQSFSPANLSETSLEDIFNFITTQSLNCLKSLWFSSMENQPMSPVFKAMFALEEDFLIFVENDFLHHLSQSAIPAGFWQSQRENVVLAAAG
jgi:hypothetical protein